VFAAVIALVLAATGFFVYLQFQNEVGNTVDAGLRSRADELAEAHGGTAHAANRPAGGADVWLVIPLSSRLEREAG
jgi:hypothetical protein